MTVFSKVRRFVCLLLALILLTGCGAAAKPKETLPPETTLPPVTEPPAPTAPADGNPNDVSCKGSYTGTVNAASVVATAGEYKLTAGILSLLYGLEVSSWRAAGTEPAPDWNLPLDVQLLDSGTEARTWQQFFLLRSLNSWHTWVALLEHSKTAKMELDPEYLPYDGNYEKYMLPTMPCMEFLYGYDPSYKVNKLHQEFIDGLPALLDSMGGAQNVAQKLGGSGEDLLTLAQMLNYAYGYFTFAHDYLGVTEEAVQARAGEISAEGSAVTFRQLLLLPRGGSEDAWQAAMEEGQRILDQDYGKHPKKREGVFADLANRLSQDQGTQVVGGLYDHVEPGVMPGEVDAWLFDPARINGDTAVVRSDVGVHVLFFREAEAVSVTQARVALLRQGDADLVAQAKAHLSMDVTYSAIVLPETPAEDAIVLTQLLYPDIGHQRIPDVPLHIQQDYTTSNYGAYTLVGWGCGITTVAMMASYMTDTWLTPAVLADRYGSYCFRSGTDAALVADCAHDLNYFIDYLSFDWREVRDTMDAEGKLAIVLQHKGYFTRGGHYLVLRDINEDGTVSIRDSNLYNYGKLAPHKEDNFQWHQIAAAGVQYWVFQPKVNHTPACHRCGGEAGGAPQEGLLRSGYTCPKCREAQVRYEDFLNLCPGV